MNIERSGSAESAILTAKEELAHLGLEFRLEALGDYPISYRCFLYDRTGTEVSVGNGKGRGEQAKASAIYEALEHLVLDSVARDSIEFLPVDQVASMSLASTERVIQMLRKDQPHNEIPCRAFKSLDGGSLVYYPLFLTQPGYSNSPLPDDLVDYRFVAKYTTNNGCAIGVNEVEALIHGLCETVERDALSCCLLETFVSHTGKGVRLIDRMSLPTSHQDLICDIEKATHSPMALVDLTSDLGIPTCLALIRDSRFALPHVGTGASLDPSSALERPALEALQCFHLHCDELEQESLMVLRRFSRLPRYRECLTLTIERYPTETIGLGEMPNHYIPGSSLGDYLQTLVGLLSNRGYTPYFAANFRGATGITCVHTLIPGLERFHLVRAGIEVLPSDRGMKLINATAPAPR